ncbi:MAG: hypothetical protein M3T96_10375 [Acidobacteriota bacterium]|nr:hypothetical protein [Acidobacteriota bacterium]
MTATEKARNVIKKFGTNDVYAIAEKAGVKIVYENWHPATVGEFDKKTRTICVNRRALESDKFSEREIITHELGHFFAAEFKLDRKKEESFAVNFAKEFAKN